MYSFKEKSRYLQNMTNPQYAEADLQLLRQLSPGHALLRTPILRPAKAADKILYALLDITTVENIRLHRRSSETKSIPSDIHLGEITVVDKLLANKCVINTPKINSNAQNTNFPNGANPPSIIAAEPASEDANSPTSTTEQPEKEKATSAPEQPVTTSDPGEALKQALAEKEAIEEERDEAIAEKEETEETLQDTQAELEAVQEELEAEKKSPEVPNDKKKKNTPPSDGETSSTETSK